MIYNHFKLSGRLIMKGLLSKLTILIAALPLSTCAEDIEITWPPQESVLEARDFELVQQFFLFIASQSSKGLECSYEYLGDRHFILTGPDAEVIFYGESFANALGKLSHEGISSFMFPRLKRAFIYSFNDDLSNRVLANEITLETTEVVKSTLVDIKEEIFNQIGDRLSDLRKNEESGENRNAPFYQLPLSESDQANISKMIKNLGELGWIGLLRKKSYMEKIGDKILHVHPLRFLGFIASKQSLREQMPKILGDFIKKNSFIHGHGHRIGFGDKMAKEVSRGNMFHHVPGFAQQVGKPEKMIHNFIKNEQWEELIREVTK